MLIEKEYDQEYIVWGAFPFHICNVLKAWEQIKNQS